MPARVGRARPRADRRVRRVEDTAGRVYRVVCRLIGASPVAVFPLRPERTFGYAPPRRDGHQAQFAEDSAGRNPHYRCEGRVGELYLRQLFHGHPGPHRRRHDLNHLDGLLPHDVRADDAPRRAVHDELAEAFRMPVDDPAIQFRVRHLSHGVVAPFVASPTLGEAHTAVLRVGEATVRHDSVPVTMFPAEHGLFGGEVPFVGGALHQHHAPRYIPGGEYVRSAGPQGVVHLYVAGAPGLHPRSLQIQILHVARPADREHDGLRFERVYFVVPDVGEPEVAVDFLDLVDPSDAGEDLDPPASERLGHPGRYRLILGGQDARREFQQVHPRAERREHRGQLASRRRTAYYGDRPGQPLHRPYVAMGQGVLDAGQRDPTRVAAHAEYELLTLHTTPVAEGEGIAVEKAGVAGPVEHPYVRGFEMVPQPLLLVDRVYDLLRTVQQPSEIHLRFLALEPVVGELLRVANQSRSLGEHAGGDAAIVRTDAAHVLALDERDVSAKLAGAQGRCNPGRPTTDHDYLKHHSPRFHVVPARQRPRPRRGVHGLHRFLHYRDPLSAQPVRDTSPRAV